MDLADRRVVAAATLAGAALRLAALVQMTESGDRWLGDSRVYKEITEGILAGRWIPDAWVWTPGYPLCAAPLAALIGSAPALILVSMISGAVLPLLVFGIGRSLGAARAGTLAAILLAFSPQSILASARPLSDSLGTTLLCWTALLALKSSGAKSKQGWCALLAGCTGGLAILTRPESVVAIPALAISALGLKVRRFHLLFAAGVLLVASPYVIALRQASGTWQLSLKPAMNIVKQRIYMEEEDYGLARGKWAEALRSFKNEQGEIDPRKLARSASTREYAAQGSAFQNWRGHVALGMKHLPAVERVLAGLGIAGLLVFGPLRGRFLFASLALPFLFAPFFVTPMGRFLLPVLPAHSWGISQLLARGLRLPRARRTLATALVGIAALAFIARGAIVSQGEARRYLWSIRLPEIESALAEGRVDDARRILEPSLRRDPDLPDVRKSQSRILQVEGHQAFAAGNLQSALQAFESAERITGPSPEIDFNLGVTLTRLGRSQEARPRFERAARSSNPMIAARAREALK